MGKSKVDVKEDFSDILSDIYCIKDFRYTSMGNKDML